MDTSQNQSSKVLNTLEDQMDELKHIISNDDGTINGKKIRKGMYELYTKIEQIMRLVDGQVIYDWDEYFMNVACLAALRSKDPRTPVGACIVTADNTIVGIGYNSMPFIKDKNNDQLFPWKGSESYLISKYHLDKKYLYVVHAAVNAIANRTIPNLEGCTIYLTHCLDEDCAHAIIQSGISHVKYGMFTRKSERDKELDIKRAAELLRLRKVSYSHFETPREPQVTVEHTVKGKILISLSKRIKKARVIASSEPEKHLVLTWEQFFMSIAMLSAQKQGSHERRPECTQGACVVSEKDKRVISVGFSGYPESMDRRALQKVENIKDQYSGDPYMCHAEYDAILSKGTPSVKGCTLYVTKYPCNMCAKVIVQTGIKKVVYFEEGEINQHTDKGKIYEASRGILATALPPKEKDPTVRHVIKLMKSGIDIGIDSIPNETHITVKQALHKTLEAALPPKDKTVGGVIELMMSGINVDVDHKAGETDIDMVKQAFQKILQGALPPKEKELKKETVKDILEFMISRINDVEDPQAGKADITVKQAFQKILEDAFSPKKKDLNKETVRDVVEWMLSVINNTVDPKGSDANITVKQIFQRILAADLPPKKEERVRQFKEVKEVILKRKVVPGCSKEAPW